MYPSRWKECKCQKYENWNRFYGSNSCICQSQSDEKTSKCQEALCEYKKSSRDGLSCICRTPWMMKDVKCYMFTLGNDIFQFWNRHSYLHTKSSSAVYEWKLMQVIKSNIEVKKTKDLHVNASSRNQKWHDLEEFLTRY